MVDRLVVVAENVLSQLMLLTLRQEEKNCYLLTTKDRNVHLNTRPDNNVSVIPHEIFRSTRESN